MKQTKHLNKVVLTIVLVGGLSMMAQAQVGSGWSSWSNGYSTQTAGCGSISGSTFSLSCSKSSSGYDRAERRYSTMTGSKQFQGTVKVNSLGGDRISLQQTFGSDAWSLIAVKKSGSLYQVEGGQTLASYSVGSSVRINAVYYSGSKQVQNYINGSLKETHTGGNIGSNAYFKIGTYRTSSGTGPVSATWSSISFYTK